jgi:hypothetical protein
MTDATAVLEGTVGDGALTMGRHGQGRPEVIVHPFEEERAVVGSYCTFGASVSILVGGLHRIDWVTTYAVREMYGLPGAWDEIPWSRGDVVIGDDVHVGTGTLIHSGVHLGTGTIVAPFSNVTRSVPPYSIVSGNPAAVRGTRFEPEAVETLLELAWWTWPDHEVRAAAGVLRSGDVGALRSLHERALHGGPRG